MIIKRIEGTTHILGRSQGFQGLPVRTGVLPVDANGHATPYFESAWELTPDEMVAIAQGGQIVLRVLGSGHPPVALYVEEAADPIPLEKIANF